MVKFSHTVFALPFALAAAALAARGHGLGRALLGIVVAMAGARTAAMGFNRIVDRHIDARNPRTAGRELPAGAVSLRAAWTLTLASAAVFVGAAAFLGPLCLALSPVALAVAVRLFVHQAVHGPVPPVPGPGHRRRPGRRLDRRARRLRLAPGRC